MCETSVKYYERKKKINNAFLRPQNKLIVYENKDEN